MAPPGGKLESHPIHENLKKKKKSWAKGLAQWLGAGEMAQWLGAGEMAQWLGDGEMAQWLGDGEMAQWLGAGEMAQWLRALAAFAEDLGSVPNCPHDCSQPS